MSEIEKARAMLGMPFPCEADTRPPRCPKCGCVMTGGAPHGDWPVQYECRACGTIYVPPK